MIIISKNVLMPDIKKRHRDTVQSHTCLGIASDCVMILALYKFSCTYVSDKVNE